MFYVQQERYAKEKNYLRTEQDFFLTDAELKGLPQGAQISVEATRNTYQIAITVLGESRRYIINTRDGFDRKGCSASSEELGVDTYK